MPSTATAALSRFTVRATDQGCESWRPRANDSGTAEDGAWLHEQEAIEERPDGVIHVEERPARWHAITSSLRAQIEKRVAEVQRWRELAEQEAKRSARRASSPSFDSWHWKSFLRDGQLVMHVPLRVSQETYERTLRIVNALCHAAEARGFEVSLNVDKSRIVLKGHGASLSVRMSEKLDDKIRREPAYAGGSLENMEVKMPTGSLKLFVGSSSRSEREVAVDDLKGKIESRNSRMSFFGSIGWSSVAASRNVSTMPGTAGSYEPGATPLGARLVLASTYGSPIALILMGG